VSKDDIFGISAPLAAPKLFTQYRELLKSYITSSHSLITFILSILNTRLQLPPSKLQNLHRLNASSGDQVRFVKAPPQPKGDRRTALGAHTDFGSVTVLFNRVGGLQVRLPASVKAIPPQSPSSEDEKTHTGPEKTNGEAGTEEQWVYVRPLPDHAIINLGDALVKFSAGILRSNVHRVFSPPGAQAEITKYSLVYFSRPEDDVLLGPLRESALIDEQAGEQKEEVISSKEWVLRRALGRREGGKYEDSGGTEEARGKRG
jgi:isopenicillin N synthase-like dioxygenase